MQNHPEWAGLPCAIRPAAQPETQGLPNLAETTIASYNVYGEPLKTEEHFGQRDPHEGAGIRQRRSAEALEEKSSSGEAMPTTVYKYNPELGGVEEAIAEGTERKTVRSEVNSLGELVAYTDASGNTSNYKYDEDERLTELNDGKGIRHLEYSETSGLPVRVTDSAFASGAFTASYDAEGNLESETFPGGLSASYVRNSAGEPVDLEYRKTTDCSANCVWYTDSAVPSIHGQWLQQSSIYPPEPKHDATLHYAYNANKSLTEVRDEVAGKCTTRQYELDEEGNRTGLITYPPGTEGKCSPEGGVTEYHAYDEANRLIDAGTAYNAFGDIERLPAQGRWKLRTTDLHLLREQPALSPGTGRAGDRLPARPRRPPAEDHLDRQDHRRRRRALRGSGRRAVVDLGNKRPVHTRMIQGISGGLAAIQHNGEEACSKLSTSTATSSRRLRRPKAPTGPSATPEENEFGVPGTGSAAEVRHGSDSTSYPPNCRRAWSRWALAPTCPS